MLFCLQYSLIDFVLCFALCVRFRLGLVCDFIRISGCVCLPSALIVLIL